MSHVTGHKTIKVPLYSLLEHMLSARAIGLTPWSLLEALKAHHTMVDPWSGHPWHLSVPVIHSLHQGSPAGRRWAVLMTALILSSSYPLLDWNMPEFSRVSLTPTQNSIDRQTERMIWTVVVGKPYLHSLISYAGNGSGSAECRCYISSSYY